MGTSKNQPDAGRGEVLRPEDAARFLAVEANTLRSWRCRGIGPPYIKLPGEKGAVRYYRGDLEIFLSQHRHVPSVRANIEKLPGS